MTSARKIVLGILCVAGVGGVGLLQSACDLISDDGSGQTGTLQLLLTDAPFPFDVISEASVTITRVEVRLSSSGTDGTGEESSEGTADSDDADGDDIGNDVGDDEEEEDNGEVSDGDRGATDGDEGKPGDTDTNTAERQASQEDDDGDDAESDEDDADDADEDDDDADDDDADDDDDDGEAADSIVDGAESNGGFLTILNDPVNFNLLELQAGVTASLASAQLTAGTYTQVRLIVSSGHVTLTDGREFDLTVPSGEQTGIKLNFDFSITTDDTTTLLVDMDVSKAFVPIPGGDVNDASQIQSFIFKPSQSIRIVRIDATGSVSGVVVDESGDPVSGVTVTASRDGQEITTTATTDDGAFALSGLEPGTYELQFSKTGFEDQSLSSLEVTTGSDTSVDDVTLSAIAAGT